MKLRNILALCLLPLSLFGQTNVQKNQVTNVLSNGSIVVGSGTSITTSGTGYITANTITGNVTWNQVTNTPNSAAGYGIINGAKIDQLGADPQTGTGAIVFSNNATLNSATMVTPNLGTPSYISLNNGSNLPTTALTGKITNSQLTNNSITITAGTGLNGGGTVALGGTVTINSTVTGTVTQVGGTGNVNGITLTGNVTTTGNLTLGGTLGNITNSQLTNNSINVVAGNGLSGGGNTQLGSSVTLNNAGVTNISTGTGISANASTGSITLSNTGVTSIVAGSNITINSTTGSVQINSSNPGGTVTSVSTNNQNGVITSVATATSTPNITIGLGNITPTSVTSVMNGSLGLTTPNAVYTNNLRTTTLTGYLYGNSTNNVSASTSIPTTALSGTITNSQLTNNSINIITSTGLSGGSNAQLGSTVTLTNTGVTNIVAGSNITVNANNGSVQISSSNPGGTVTSVGLAAPSGLTVTNSPVTSSGTLTLSTTLNGYVSGNGNNGLTASTTIPGSAITGNIAGNAANVTGIVAVVNGGTGVTTSTGSGSNVLSNSPTLVTPNLGQPTYADLTNATRLPLSSGVTGILPVANGGTSVTTSSGANSVVLRDSNSNVSANNFYSGFSNQAASGTTLVLTASSVPNYAISGSGGQVIKLPDATTLPNGTLFSFNNNQSSGTITVQNNSGTTVCTTQSGAYIYLVLLSNGSAAGTWDYHNVLPTNASWSTNTLSWAGSYTNGTWNGNAIGALYGGTGTNGLTGYVYGNGTSAMTASTTIPTSALTSNSITVTAGTGLSGGGTVALGGSTTLSNAGVTNVIAGTGVTVNSSTGSVTINATGTGGTVTNLSVTGNSGVLAGVATPTTTPAISIGLGNITPTSVNSQIGNTTPNTGAFTTISASGVVNITNNTGSTSQSTGALIVNGGLGIGGSINSTGTVAGTNLAYSGGYFGGTSDQYAGLAVFGDSAYPYSTHFNAYSLQFGTGSNGARSTRMFIDYVGQITTAGASVLATGAGALTIGATTSSGSTSTGALVVGNGSSGGLGVGGAINAGGTIYDKYTTPSSAATSTGFQMDNGTNYFNINATGSAFSYAGVGSNELWYYTNSNFSALTFGSDGNIPIKFVSNGAEKMRITGAGNVGIGTTSPTAWGTGGSLEVDGSGGGVVAVKYNGTSVGYLLANSNNFSINGRYTNPITFFTNGNEQMRITSAGNVGIGTIPLSSNTSYRALETIGGTNILSNTGGNYGFLGNNAYIDSSYAFRYVNTGYVTLEGLNNGNGSYVWYTAPSGTAGNTVSLNNYMNLSNSGTLTLAATTSSSSTTSGALQVAGGVGIQGSLNLNGYSGNTLNLANGSSYSWNGNFAPIQNGLMSLVYDNNNGASFYNNGGYFNTSNNWVYTSTSYSPAIFFQQNGNSWWQTNLGNSGTAGGTFSPTNIMSLSSKGALGVYNYDSGSAVITSIQEQAGSYVQSFLAYNNGGSYYFAGFYNSGGTPLGSIISNGTITSYNTTSDKRLKSPLRSWSLGDKFDDLPIGEFTWKESGVIGHGTLAQDLYKIYPDAVHKGDDGTMPDPKKTGSTWEVDYGKLTVPLIAEVKTLRSRVKTLEQDQATVLEAINQLKAEFNQYKKDHP